MPAKNSVSSQEARSNQASEASQIMLDRSSSNALPVQFVSGKEVAQFKASGVVGIGAVNGVVLNA